LKADWRAFLHECSTSPGYYSLRDICQELCEGKKLSEAELNAIFIPDYFATPMKCHM